MVNRDFHPSYDIIELDELHFGLEIEIWFCFWIPDLALSPHTQDVSKLRTITGMGSVAYFTLNSHKVSYPLAYR